LEGGGRDVRDFFAGNPLQCPGVIVRRDVYQACGGFRSDLTYTLDWEMWVRAITHGGGVVLPQVLACYRNSPLNETNRLGRRADNLRDMKRLGEEFATAHPEFSCHRHQALLAYLAANQIELFRQHGDAEALAANLAFMRREVPFKYRWRERLARLGRRMLG
jgi:hypothetical protein